MNAHQNLIKKYKVGPALLRQTIAGMSCDQFDAVPIPGKWSTRQVICHIADFELVYADRMKRVIAEYEPTFFGGDPDAFAARLVYANRDVEEEFQLIEAVRRQMIHILNSLEVTDFERIGNHSENGPLTLAALLLGVTNHLPHHAAFIEKKLAAIVGS